MIDDRTPQLDLPLPNVNNLMKSEDVPRLRSALALLDQAVADRATKADVQAAIAEVVGAAPAALNTLQEISDALGDDANFAATITAQLATKLSAVPIATSVELGGIKIGPGLVVAADGTLSTTGAGSGSGLPSFAEVTLTPSANGQTTFVPSGGYIPGQIELYLNGVLLYGGGDDYTASDGVNITLTAGVNTVDKLLLRNWYYIPIERAVNKTGDTMTGHLSVPPNASGTQVPQAQEVVKKAGDTMTGTMALNGSESAIGLLLTNAAEKVTVVAAPAAGTVNLDVTTQSVLYYTQASTGNWTLNVRGNASSTLNSLLDAGQGITVSLLATQGATPYYPNAIQIDGALVTPVWQGGVAPVAGNASSLDVYALTIIKTGNAAFTVLASQSQFKA